MPDIDQMGPVDYVVVEFPGRKLPGMPLLATLVERGIIRILDLAFVHKDTDGSVVQLSVGELVEDNPELLTFEGAACGLLLPEDIQDAGGVLDPGTVGLVVVYENSWLAPLAVAFRRGGGQLIADARIPIQGLLAALDAAEASMPAAPVG
jgi:hypothetical protein